MPSSPAHPQTKHGSPREEGRTAAGALVPLSAAPGWARRVWRKGWGGEDRKSRHSRAVGPSPPGRELLGGSTRSPAAPLRAAGAGWEQALAPTARCTPRVRDACGRGSSRAASVMSDPRPLSASGWLPSHPPVCFCVLGHSETARPSDTVCSLPCCPRVLGGGCGGSKAKAGL